MLFLISCCTSLSCGVYMTMIYSWSPLTVWHILWLKRGSKRVYLYTLYMPVYVLFCIYFADFPVMPVFLLLHLFCNYFRFCVDVGTDVAISWCCFENLFFSIFHVVHVLCWCSIECWNMSMWFCVTLNSGWLNVPVGCFNASWNIQVLPLKFSFIYALRILFFKSS